MKQTLYILFAVGIFLLAVGFEARPMARCGVGTCFIGIVTNQEFKWW